MESGGRAPESDAGRSCASTEAAAGASKRTGPVKSGTSGLARSSISCVPACASPLLTVAASGRSAGLPA